MVGGFFLFSSVPGLVSLLSDVHITIQIERGVGGGGRAHSAIMDITERRISHSDRGIIPLQELSSYGTNQVNMINFVAYSSDLVRGEEECAEMV